MTDVAAPHPVFGAGELRAEFAEALPELAIPWHSLRPENPTLVTLNEPLARELGWDPEQLGTPAGIRALLGNDLPTVSRPVAQAYAGHQFGHYAARLGDGRALLLGEVTDAHGRVRDIHLKGSGRTPFARADGVAALGPMLREYLVSEAMHAQGIPTTRALAVIATGRLVPRDGELQPGAVLVRVAASHLRVGSFQYASATGDRELLTRLVDFALARHAPGRVGEADPVRALLETVVASQAELIAQWMLGGFVHGVMNTDNMTISGETIDYGPCAFLDAYDPTASFSSIDHAGRYAYGEQPRIGLWNLTRLAEALLPLWETQDVALAVLDGYAPAYEAAWVRGMARKLGIAAGGDAGLAGAGSAVPDIAGAFLAELQRHRIDLTRGFRALTAAAQGDTAPFLALYPGGSAPGEWFDLWRALGQDAALMRRNNPIYIPRNHLVDEALAAASDAGDFAPFERLLAAVSAPYDELPAELPAELPDRERYADPDPSGHRFVSYCGT